MLSLLHIFYIWQLSSLLYGVLSGKHLYAFFFLIPFNFLLYKHLYFVCKSLF